MADEKKYYWLKLKRDFFKRHDIRIIEEMPNGKDYILFYLKLLLESIDHEGALRFSDTVPYNEQMLSVITNTNVDTVRSAMKMFTELGMVDIFDDQTIYMNEVQKIIGSETKWAAKKRIQRAKRDNVPRLSSKCPTEIEIDKDKDKEIRDKSEKKDIRHKYGEYQNVLLSDSDMEKLKTEFPKDYQERIENLSSYMRSSGKSYKDHLATIRNWARKDAEKVTPKNSSSSFDVDEFFEAALRRGYEKDPPKTAADDEEIRRRAEALKGQLG